MNENKIVIPDEIIVSKIYFIRGYKVMLDSDLAELYQVETKRLNEQVKRNIKRFPEDFMFQLTDKEWEILKSQFATSSWGGRRINPFVFTEHGVLMLSSVLNSDRAIEVNIKIVRVYNQLKRLLSIDKELFSKVEEMEKKIIGQDEKILKVFSYLQRFIKQTSNREEIGYKK